MTKNMMFPLNLRGVNLFQPYAQNVSNTYDTLLWHASFCYIPFKSSSLLQKHAIIKGLPILNIKTILVKVVYLESIREKYFQNPPIEKNNFYNWFTQTSMDQCKLNPLVEVFIF
jgi:hypothetical protein